MQPLFLRNNQVNNTVKLINDRLPGITGTRLPPVPRGILRMREIHFQNSLLRFLLRIRNSYTSCMAKS